jgi:hypothetical protein
MNFYRHSGSANSSRSARLALTIASWQFMIKDIVFMLSIY